MKILIRAVGKMRDARLADLCEEYLKRARRHLPIDVLEAADDAALLRGLPPGTELIALEPGGEAWDTARFITQVTKHMNQGSKAVAFLIGGADGLGRDVVAACHRRLSLTPLTLPHRLARLILCEQIYRALATIRGEPYNK